MLASDDLVCNWSKWSAKQNEIKNKKWAIATMVLSPEFTVGANVLLHSVLRHGPTDLVNETTFIILLVKEHEDNHDIINKLHPLWSICTAPLIPSNRPEQTVVRFREQFTKLWLWSLTSFQRVLYMDSDTLALADITPLLITPNRPFAAVLDWEKGEIIQTFNMGVFSIRPDAQEFSRLTTLQRSKIDYPAHMAEQAFLNSIYNRSNVFEVWPFRYNGNLAAAAQRPEFWKNETIQLKIIHYTYIKPFQHGRNPRKWPLCKQALDLWWAEYLLLIRAHPALTFTLPPESLFFVEAPRGITMLRMKVGMGHSILRTVVYTYADGAVVVSLVLTCAYCIYISCVKLRNNCSGGKIKDRSRHS